MENRGEVSGEDVWTGLQDDQGEVSSVRQPVLPTWLFFVIGAAVVLTALVQASDWFDRWNEKREARSLMIESCALFVDGVGPDEARKGVSIVTRASLLDDRYESALPFFLGLINVDVLQGILTENGETNDGLMHQYLVQVEASYGVIESICTQLGVDTT